MKNNKTQQILSEWEIATNKLSQHFVTQYFDKDAEVWWVADDIGDVLVVNDYFFNLKQVVEFIKYRYSREMLFEYYEYSLNLAEKGKTPINIRCYAYTITKLSKAKLKTKLRKQTKAG